MSADKPLVSVIIPCFNLGRFLEEAVASVLAQSWDNLEVIIIDDGSTDPDTRALLDAFDNPRARVLRTSNRGVCAARNTGIEQSSGKYILPLDADDKIATHYVERAVQHLEANPNLGIVYSEAALFGNENGPWPLQPYSFPEILVGNMIFCSALFRFDDWKAVGGYNTKMVEGWEDFDFWISIIELGREVYRIPEPCFFYRRHGVSRNQRMAEDPERYVNCFMQIYRNHERTYRDNMRVVFQEIIKLREDLLEQGRDRVKLNGMVKDLREENQALRQQLSSQQQSLKAVETLEAEKAGLQRELDQQTRAMQSLTRDLEAMRHELSDLRSRGAFTALLGRFLKRRS